MELKQHDQTLLIWAVVFLAITAGAATAEASLDIFKGAEPSAPADELDRIVVAKLAELAIRLALCSDAVFVRRV